MRPQLLLLDEPTRGMDGLRKLALAELVRASGRRTAARVGVITHDIDFAAEAAEAVTTMARGRVLADGAPSSCSRTAGSSPARSGWRWAASSIAEAGRAAAHGDGSGPRV